MSTTPTVRSELRRGQSRSESERRRRRWWGLLTLLVLLGLVTGVVVGVLYGVGVLGSSTRDQRGQSHSSAEETTTHQDAAPPPSAPAKTTSTSLSSLLQTSLGSGDALQAAIAEGNPIGENPGDPEDETDTESPVFVPQDGDTCMVATADQLRRAVEQMTCGKVFMTNASWTAYVITEEIVVRRRVAIMGHPAVVPRVDAYDSVRAFKVNESGFLEMKYVRIQQGLGVLQRRENGLGEIKVIRGGGVMVDETAAGADFHGVIFLNQADRIEDVQIAVEDTNTATGMRTYGGHLYVGNGTVTLTSCQIYGSVAVLAMNDQMSVGGDLLLVAGTLRIISCTITVATLFAVQGGAGISIGVLGGTLVMLWTIYQTVELAAMFYGTGLSIFVGGGTAIMVGVDIRDYSVVLEQSGIGAIMVMGGTIIKVGVTIESFYWGLAAVGAGFYVACGVGIFHQAGVTYWQVTGPAYSALSGAGIFLGSGHNVNTGLSTAFIGTANGYFGDGGLGANHAGYMEFVGNTYVTINTMTAFNGLGGTWANSAGISVQIGNPVFTTASLIQFAGLGSIFYHNAGSAVIGYSPSYGPSALTSNLPDGAPYWVMGNVASDGTGPVEYVPPISSRSTQDLATIKGFHPLAKRHLNRNRRRLLSLGKGTSFLAQNVHHYSGPLNLTDSWFTASPFAKMLSPTLQEAVALAQSTRGRWGRKTSERPPDIFINGSVENMGQCRMCDVGTVEGPGSEACDVQPECGDSGVVDSLEFFPYYIQDVTLNADPSVTSMRCERGSTATLRNAVRDMIASSENSVNLESVHVSVSRTQPREYWPLKYDDHGPIKRPAGCGNALVYKLTFVTNNETSHKALKAAFTDDAVPLFQLFMENVRTALGVSEQAGPDSLTFNFQHEIMIPAYNSPALYQAFQLEQRQRSGSNSIRVVGIGLEGIAQSMLVIGQTYLVQLDKFPALTQLTIQLIGRSEGSGQEQSDGYSPAWIQTVTLVRRLVLTDSNGSTQFLWLVTAVLQPGDGYYLKASAADGSVIAMSHLLTITTEGSRRKKRRLGPLMERPW